MDKKAPECIAQLKEQLRQAITQIWSLARAIAATQKCIEESEKQKTLLSVFVKANVAKPKEEQKKMCKKRVVQPCMLVFRVDVHD